MSTAPFDAPDVRDALSARRPIRCYVVLTPTVAHHYRSAAVAQLVVERARRLGIKGVELIYPKAVGLDLKAADARADENMREYWSTYSRCGLACGLEVSP